MSAAHLARRWNRCSFQSVSGEASSISHPDPASPLSPSLTPPPLPASSQRAQSAPGGGITVQLCTSGAAAGKRRWTRRQRQLPHCNTGCWAEERLLNVWGASLVSVIVPLVCFHRTDTHTGSCAESASTGVLCSIPCPQDHGEDALFGCYMRLGSWAVAANRIWAEHRCPPGTPGSGTGRVVSDQKSVQLQQTSCFRRINCCLVSKFVFKLEGLSSVLSPRPDTPSSAPAAGGREMESCRWLTAASGTLPGDFLDVLGRPRGPGQDGEYTAHCASTSLWEWHYESPRGDLQKKRKTRHHDFFQPTIYIQLSIWIIDLSSQNWKYLKTICGVFYLNWSSKHFLALKKQGVHVHLFFLKSKIVPVFKWHRSNNPW